MRLKIFDFFAGPQPTDEWEEAKAISRKEVKDQYEAAFRDELRREDAKLARLDYPTNVMDPRRRQEMADGGMIREDDKAFANLPAQAIHHEYPSLGYYSTPYIDSLGKRKLRVDKNVSKPRKGK